MTLDQTPENKIGTIKKLICGETLTNKLTKLGIKENIKYKMLKINLSARMYKIIICKTPIILKMKEAKSIKISFKN